jgi:hypothetical protein
MYSYCTLDLEVCHPLCVKSIIQCIMCIYIHIHAFKNTTIRQMLSPCNMQNNVIYNYMFRPCKWAFIGLFIEPVRWLYVEDPCHTTRPSQQEGREHKIRTAHPTIQNYYFVTTSKTHTFIIYCTYTDICSRYNTLRLWPRFLLRLYVEHTSRFPYLKILQVY